MKNLLNRGSVMLPFALIALFTSCKKDIGGENPNRVVISAVPPATPLWYGGTGTINYTASNATKVTVDGTMLPSTSGSYPAAGITANKTYRFVATGADGSTSTSDVTVSVYSENTTFLCRAHSGTDSVFSQKQMFIDGADVTTASDWDKDIFFTSGKSTAIARDGRRTTNNDWAFIGSGIMFNAKTYTSFTKLNDISFKVSYTNSVGQFVEKIYQKE